MPSMSPRTQQMQMASGAGVDQATAMFEKGFSEMSYNVLLAKLPDIVEDVVTFKVLDVDLDQGTGIGAFVLMRGEQPLYIPVVMSDNNLKPLEMIYHKGLNIFLPLSKQWLEEMDKTELGSLGKGIKTPQSLYTDVDIRNVVVPPITGRFSYAAWEPFILADVARVINHETLEKVASEPRRVLIEFLDAAPNFVKVAFTNVLKKNPRVLKQAAQVYGVQALTGALRLNIEKVAASTLQGAKMDMTLPGGHKVRKGENISILPYDHKKKAVPVRLPSGKTIYLGHTGSGKEAAEKLAACFSRKVASATGMTGGGLWIADKDTTTTQFKRVFGDKAPEAYAGVKVKGFAAKDTRKKRNHAVREQPYQHWTEPNQPGVYTLYTNKQEEKAALVIPYPVDLIDNHTKKYDKKPVAHGHGAGHDYDGVFNGRGTKRFPAIYDYDAKMDYLAVFANGDYIKTDKLVGETSVVDELAGGALHRHLFKGGQGTPKVGKGFFVRQHGGHIEATEPLEIKSITTDSEGARRLKATRVHGWGEPREIVTQKKHPYGDIWMPKGASIVYLPPTYMWIPLKEKLNAHDFFRCALDLAGCASSSLSAVGAKKVTVKNASAGQFSINGARALDYVPALKKLAGGYVLPVEVAEELLTKAADDRSISFWVATGEMLARAQQRLQKLAQDPAAEAPPPEEPPPEEMPPEEMMPPEEAMAPPPPSPTDLAAMEMQQQIDQEMAKLVEKKEMLDALTMRTQEIATGAPVPPTVQTEAMGAPPIQQNLATGEPTPPMGPDQGPFAPPAPGGALPQDPSMMGQDPSMMGQDPSMMDPSGMGQDLGMMEQDPSMMDPSGMEQDPGMMGQDPSMMDPSMMGQDPSMMGQEQQMPPMAMMGQDGPNERALEEEINPQFLEQAGQLQSDDIFDAAAVSSLAQSPAIKELVAQYVPNLEKALDNLGRVILSLWMQEPDLKTDVGDAAFADLEDSLRTTFKNLGDLVLKLSQSAHTIRGPLERAGA